jgi:integrase
MIKPRIRKRDGRKVYDVRLRDPGGKEYARTFETRKAAEAFEASEKTARNRGTWVDPRDGNRLFPDVADAWLAANPAKRANTWATDESTVSIHLAPALPGRIASYTQPDIQALVNKWVRPAAPRTVKPRYGVLQAIFAYAVDADWLGRSPCRDIKLPRVTSTRRTKLTADHVDAIASAMDPRYSAMVWVGAILGLRWSEVAGLRVGAFDLLARSVPITDGGTIIRDAKGRPVVSDPKSRASHATLPTPTVLVDILAEHLAARGLTAADGERLLFEAPEGGALRYSNWRSRVWLPAVADAGYPGAGFHELRRANATALVRDGVDVRTAQSLMRHSDPGLTIGLYADVVAEAERQAVEKMGSAFIRSRDGRGMNRSPKSHQLGRNRL